MAYNKYHESVLKNGMHWWTAPANTMHEDIFAFLSHVENDQAYKATNNLRYMRLYGNYEMTGLDSFSYSRVEQSHSVKHRVTLNVIQSMVDTVVSKMTKNKPRPMFLTQDGDWTLQNRAKKLSKFCDGVFSSTNFYQEATAAFRDSCIFGTGAIKIFKDNGCIKAERVFIDEIKIDESEAYYAPPRHMHQVKYIQKDVLCEMFPGKKFQIDSANSSSDSHSFDNNRNNVNLIRVVESWHLPSKPVSADRENQKPHDGRHVISIANAVLHEEPYTKSHFPFVFFRWTEQPVGFWGRGLSEMLQGIQLEINKILRTIQVSMHLCSIPKIFVEASSKVVTSHLNNKIGGIIKYAGTPPRYEQLGSVPSELFSHLDRLYNRAFEIAGISALSAQAQKPTGLDSGKAIRTFNDIESERFMEVGQRFENAFMEAAKIIVGMAREIYQDMGEFKVKVKGRKFIETIDWSEVDIEDDKFMMDVFPTSSLSQTPAGRLQDVQDLLTAGFISKEDGLKLLDFPDLEGSMTLLNAGIEDIEKTIERMVERGEYETPEPYQNLELGIKKCQQAYLKYKSQGAPDEVLELLRRWMEDAQGLLKKALEGINPPPPLDGSQVLANDMGSTSRVDQAAALQEAASELQEIDPAANAPETIAQGELPMEDALAMQDVPLDDIL